VGLNLKDLEAFPLEFSEKNFNWLSYPIRGSISEPTFILGNKPIFGESFGGKLEPSFQLGF